MLLKILRPMVKELPWYVLPVLSYSQKTVNFPPFLKNGQNRGKNGKIYQGNSFTIGLRILGASLDV